MFHTRQLRQDSSAVRRSVLSDKARSWLCFLVSFVCAILPFVAPALGQRWIEPENFPIALESQPIDLDHLSDQELIDLYISTAQGSERRDVFDASTLATNSWLVQFGYAYSFDQDESGFRHGQHTVPELLIRYRVLERLEVRLAWAGITFDDLTDELTGITDRTSRSANPSIGARFALWSQQGWLPRTSVTASSPFDLESNANLLNRVDPLLSVGYSWLLGEHWLIAGTSAAVWTLQDNDRFLDYQQSLSCVWFLGDRWDVTATWSGLFPEGNRVDGMSHTIGPGLSYSLNEHIQLDVLTGFGIDDLSPDFVVQSFVTWRP